MIQLSKKWRIDGEGNLWMGDTLITEEFPRMALCERGSFTALDGSRVTLFDGPGGKLRRFRRDGRTWWDVPGTLCTPREIDAVRKEIAAKGAVTDRPRVTPGGAAG